MRRSFSLRLRVFMLLLVAVLPLVALSVFWTVLDEQRDLADARARLQSIAVLEASHHARTAEAARQLLVALARSRDVRDGTPQACRAYLAALHDIAPQYNNFGVIDVDGRLRCNSRVPGDSIQVSVDGVGYFQEVLRTRSFAVGQFQIGRLSGQKVLGFGYPVTADDGIVTGVAFASIRLDRIQMELGPIATAEGAQAIVLDRNGLVLAASDPGVAQGQPLGMPWLDVARLSMRAGVQEQVGPDGTVRMYSYAPAPGVGGSIFVVFSIKRDAVIAESQSRLWVQLGWLAAVTVVAAAAAWVYARGAIVRPTGALLGEARATQNLILDTMREGVVAIDTQRNFLMFNEAARRVFDPPADPASVPSGKPLLGGIVNPLTGQPFPTEDLPLYRALRGESGSDVDMFVQNDLVPSGRMLRANYGPIRDRDGTIVGALGVFTDITERHWHEVERERDARELLRTQRRLLYSQRVGRIGNWESNLQTRSFWWSDEVYELFGMASRNFDNSFAGFNALVHPDDRAMLQARRDEAAQVSGVLDVEFRIVTPSGEVRWIYVRGERKTDDAGRTVGLAGVVQDITARKLDELRRAQAEEQLKESARQLSRLVEVLLQAGETLDTQAALIGRMAELACEITGAAGAEFEMIEGDEFVLASHAGALRRPLGERRPRQAGRLSARVLSETVVVRVDDVAAEPSLNPVWAERVGARSMAGIAVRAGGEPVGVLALVDARVAAFGDATSRVLQLFAEFAGAMLQRRRADRSAAEHLFTLQRSADAAQAIVRHHSLGDTLREVAEQLRRVIPSHQAAVTVLGSEGWRDALHTVSLSVRDQPMQARLQPPDGEGFGALVCETLNVLRLSRDEVRRHPRWRGHSDAAAQAGGLPDPPVPNGWLAVPLIGREGRVLGAMQLRDKVEGAFTLQDEYVVQEMAHLVSVAIENARLFDEIQALNRGLENKVAERSRELARQEAVFRAVADQAPQVMWIVNRKGAVTYLNRYWYDLVGGEPPRWQGHEWMETVNPEDVAEMRAKWSVSARDLSVFQGVRRVAARDGTIHTLSYRASPVLDDMGQVICWVGLDADITEIKAIENALRLANHELETFSYSVSHDLRSPLNTIDGFSRMLEREVASGGPRTGHFIARIQAATRHMGELIEGLLSLSQVSRQALRRAPVDMSALASEILERFVREQPTRPARLNVQPGMSAQADERMVRALLQNLLANAWKFSAGKPETFIEVGCLAERGKAPVFFVRDHGAGFDMQYANKLFGTFQRLHSQHEFDGTGIGLATVKRIVTRHGGMVWAHAQQGEGATFWFTLTTADTPDGVSN